MGIANPVGGIRPFALLTEGATTVVYKGYDQSLDRYVLLKVLKPEYAADEEIVARFEEEARLIARVQHTNVVSIHAFGRDERQAFLVTEFVEGVSVRQLSSGRALPWEIAAFVIAQAARGLHAAHERGVLHRDVKPDNILVSQSGHVTVSDFGLALYDVADQEEEDLCGTLGYMAPEVVLNGQFAVASDLFALGATLLELLTGTPPFEGEESGEVLHATVHYDPTTLLNGRRDLPDALVALCKSLLGKDPMRRPASAAFVAAALEETLQKSAPATGELSVAKYLAEPDAFRSEAKRPLVPVVGYSKQVVVPWQGSRRGSGANVGQEVQTVSPAVPARRERRRTSVLARSLLVVAAALTLLFVGGRWLSGRMASPRPISALLSTASDSLALQDSAATAAADSLLRPVSDPAAADQTAKNARPPRRSDRALRARSAVQDSMSFPAGSEPASLLVVCQPWCEVVLDGRLVGVTPLERPISVPPGSYALDLRHPDFPARHQRVRLEPGGRQSVTVSLWDSVGRLNVATTPSANVLVDGVSQGVTPATLVITPGSHTLTFYHQELGTYQRQINIEAGSEETMQYDLQKLLGN